MVVTVTVVVAIGMSEWEGCDVGFVCGFVSW